MAPISRKERGGGKHLGEKIKEKSKCIILQERGNRLCFFDSKWRDRSAKRGKRRKGQGCRYKGKDKRGHLTTPTHFMISIRKMRATSFCPFCPILQCKAKKKKGGRNGGSRQRKGEAGFLSAKETRTGKEDAMLYHMHFVGESPPREEEGEKGICQAESGLRIIRNTRN